MLLVHLCIRFPNFSSLCTINASISWSMARCRYVHSDAFTLAAVAARTCLESNFGFMLLDNIGWRTCVEHMLAVNSLMSLTVVQPTGNYVPELLLTGTAVIHGE